MAKKLFIGSLSWNVTDAQLSEFFSQAGTVVSANVIIDRYSNRSKGFGFVEMSTEEEAEQARKLDGQPLDGRNIVVTEAKPQQPRENNFSGGGGGNFNRRDGGGGGGRDDRRGNDRRGGGRDNNRRGGGRY